MPGITEALTHKVGPLPVWAYAVIVAGGAWVWFYLRGGSDGTDTGTNYPSEATVDSNLVDEAGANSSGVGGNGSVPAGSGAPSSNQGWYQLSSTYLVGFGYDGVTVGNALSKYLIGEPLTVTERALVSQAIARYGLPPEGVPPSTGGEPTRPTPGRDGTPKPPPRRSPIHAGPDIIGQKNRGLETVGM